MRKVLGSLFTFLVVGVCSLAFALTTIGIVMLLLTGNGAGKRDFVSYWAAGHQIANHQDPYDSEAIRKIERSTGLEVNAREVIMRNPPSALLLVLPLCLFNVKIGALFWSLLLLSCLAVSVHMLWVMHGRPKDYIHLLGYSFGPALTCLFAGQTALFALCGLVIFLRFHKTHSLWAGTSLWLCVLKPHLFLPFAVVLIAWVLFTKRYTILAGAVAALAISSTVASVLDPLVWHQYRHLMTSWGVEREYIPCLSVMLRLSLRPDAMWLQYVPAALACIWAVSYFYKHRDNWNWMEHGSLIMLVSILAAPYAWSTDEAVLLPAILGAAYLTRSHTLIGILALVSAAIEMEVLFMAPLHSRLYMWTAPAWLAWYLCAHHHAMKVDGRRSATSPPSLVAS